MQKIHKVIISLIISCLITVVIPFNVFADDYIYDFSGGCTNYMTVQGSYNWYSSQSSATTYIVMDYLNYDSLKYATYWLSDSPFTYSDVQNNACSGTSQSATLFDQDGYHFYYQYHDWRGNLSFNTHGYNSNITELDNWSVDLTNRLKEVYDIWKGGSSSIYGDLTVGFHTNFSASGTSENYQIIQNTNLDTIEWKRTDSLGNNLADKGANVEIRAVPVLFSDADRNTFLAQTIQDAVINYNDALILWQGNFNDYHKSFLWKDVIYQLEHSSAVFFISAMFTGGVWKKYGWIYQIRYNIVLEDFTSEWQTIYNSTSISVDDGEHILNTYYYNYPSGLNPDDKEIFQTINNYNNTENNTWYVNDVPIDTSSDVSWLETLVQAITELIGKILDFFKGIFDGLVDLILGLFDNINPADSFFNWFSDLFNGIGDIDLSLPLFNIPSEDLSSFNRLVQETMDIFSFNNFGFVLFIPLLLIIIKAVF